MSFLWNFRNLTSNTCLLLKQALNYTTVASDSIHLRNMISSIVFSNECVCQLSVRARGIYKVLV